MRKAAGIILIILGVWLLVGFVVVLIDFNINVHDAFFDVAVPFMICGAFLVAGGIFCLKKKYLGLCWGSAFMAVLCLIGSLIVSYTSLTWLDWICAILGTIAMIFVCLRANEWQEISDVTDCKVSYDG